MTAAIKTSDSPQQALDSLFGLSRTAAAALAGAVMALVQRTMGDTPTGRVVRAAAPILVMGIATFMILTQLQIAKEIVTITYAALMATAVLGLGLAFRLGGRQVAADMLQNAYDKGREQKDQVKDDLDKGRQRAEDQAGQARDQLGGSAGSAEGTPPSPPAATA